MFTNDADEREERIRKEDALQRAGGVLRLGGGIAGFAVAALASVYRQFAHVPCPYEWVMFALGACMVAVIAGMLEKVTRPMRVSIAALVDQVAVLEQKVDQLPGYGDGVIDGVRFGVKLAEGTAAAGPDVTV